jgi:hypothetical protein
LIVQKNQNAGSRGGRKDRNAKAANAFSQSCGDLIAVRDRE